MGEEQQKWKRMRFRRNKVWLAVDAENSPIVRDKRVLIKYQLDQDYEYWVNLESVYPLDETETPVEANGSSPPQKAQALTPSQVPEPKPEPNTDEIIHIYTDGASSGNPGPSGIGVVLKYGGHEKEISRFIGTATNNIAELEAIRVGLEAVKRRDLPVRIYTDSQYAFGLLNLGWKARMNQEQVQSLRELMKGFRDVRLVKVRGHAGDPANERADRLAVEGSRKLE